MIYRHVLNSKMYSYFYILYLYFLNFHIFNAVLQKVFLPFCRQLNQHNTIPPKYSIYKNTYIRTVKHGFWLSNRLVYYILDYMFRAYLKYQTLLILQKNMYLRADGANELMIQSLLKYFLQQYTKCTRFSTVPTNTSLSFLFSTVSPHNVILYAPVTTHRRTIEDLS